MVVVVLIFLKHNGLYGKVRTSSQLSSQSILCMNFCACVRLFLSRLSACNFWRPAHMSPESVFSKTNPWFWSNYIKWSNYINDSIHIYAIQSTNYHTNYQSNSHWSSAHVSTIFYTYSREHRCWTYYYQRLPLVPVPIQYLTHLQISKQQKFH